MTILVCAIIGAVVTWVAAMLDRNERRYYYFAVGVVLGGALISFVGNQNRSVTAYNYYEVATQFVDFERRSGGDSLGIRTSTGEYFISPDYLPEHEREIILAADWSARQATIWLESPSSSQVKGLAMDGIEINRFRIAAIDREFYRRLTNVGFIISGVGGLLFILHYFTSRKERSPVRWK